MMSGAVLAEGLDLRFASPPIEETISRMLRDEAFDVAEMSLSAALMVHERDPARWALLPIFPSRMFRHSSVFINTDKGIERPADLAGRRVGTPLFARLTAGVWIRGILEERFDLVPHAVSWILQESCPSGSEDGIPMEEGDWRWESVGWQTSLEELLVRGEIDALVSARIPGALRQGDSRVARLFSDFATVEADYFTASGIFPPMHVLVVRGDVYELHPWIGPRLFEAFVQAKRSAREADRDIDVSRHSLAWWTHYLESESARLGPDPWVYGVEANRRPLETFVRYCRRQGLLTQEVAVSGCFPENVRELTDQSIDV